VCVYAIFRYKWIAFYAPSISLGLKYTPT